MANFINAELWGRPTALPWGVAFPGEAAQDCPNVVGTCFRHPSQLYEAGLEGLLLGRRRRGARPDRGGPSGDRHDDGCDEQTGEDAENRHGATHVTGSLPAGIGASG